ncbi:hypothetical protein M422DRAFT_249575 [Sphaerobolus stellatus SS14]|uniref:Uncharacterized protein n=1 Tax=Sphaerobolus stellatus (strain SS14) TaxID=990650 RepID=A0A0C9VHQ8_SPHS4|nr:hypothetical protein M422DRAFT_249575 [Sphaerobolus stellatus SS14]
MPQKLERQHRPSSESVTEPESETEPEFQPEQTKATSASKVNYSKFYPFKPTTHISPALQPVKLLSNVPLVNSSHAKRPTLKREASSSPKVRDDDKENIHPGPPPLKQRRLDNPDPPSSLSCEVRSLRFVMEEMVEGQKELLKELKRIGRRNENALERLTSTIDTKL